MLLPLAVLLQLQLPAPVGYINDFAHVVRPADSLAMAGVIDEVRRKCGGEIVVVTLPDIKDRAPIEVARDIGRAWKVGATGAAGDPRRNTGIVVLLVPGRRPGDGRSQLAIATGMGAEGFVTDAMAGRVRDAIGREAVASGSFGRGLAAGVAMLGQAYAQEFHFELTGAPAATPMPTGGGGNGAGTFPWGIVFAVVLLILASMFRGGRGLLWGLFWGSAFGGGWGGGGRGGRWGGGGGGFGGFGGFGGGGGFSGGGASGRF